MIPALQLPLLWHVCYIKQWAKRCPGYCVPSQHGLSSGAPITISFMPRVGFWITARHCSSHLFKAHTFNFCFSFLFASRSFVCRSLKMDHVMSHYSFAECGSPHRSPTLGMCMNRFYWKYEKDHKPESAPRLGHTAQGHSDLQETFCVVYLPTHPL